MVELFVELSRALSIIMAPLGHNAYWFDLMVWPIVTGVFALWVYKLASNQAGINAAKNGIKAHLLEIRIFRDQPRTVLGATLRIAIQNTKYLAYNLVPMLIMIGPMFLVLVQLESQFAFAPAAIGNTALLRVEMAPGHNETKPTDIRLRLPEGLTLEAPPVRTTSGEIYWRIRLDAAGDHVLNIEANGQRFEKMLSVGGEARPVSWVRTNTWLAILYPTEPALPSTAPIQTIAFPHPESELGWLPGGELGIVLWFLGLSLIVGYALKDLFGVSL